MMPNVMTHEFPQNKSLFDCADLIKPLKCFGCANFETHHLSDLKHHIKAGHTLPEKPQAKLHQCGGCKFETYSKFLFSRHQLLDVCMSGWKLTSEAGFAQAGTYDNDDDLEFIEHSYCLFVKPSQAVWHDHNYAYVTHRSNRKQLYKCRDCPYTSKCTRSFKNHILVKHTDPDLIRWAECAHCSYKTLRKCDLKKHVDYQHGGMRHLKCDHCPFETKFGHSLKYHVLTKHTKDDDITWFQCDQCPFKTLRKNYLKCHTDHKHGNKKRLKCGHCSHETVSKWNLRNHIISQHTAPERIQWWRCAQCPFKCKTKGNLKVHVDYKHGREETLKCEHCRFETNFIYALKRHILAQHTEQKPLAKCEFCQYATNVMGNLRLHILVKHTHHDKIQWFECAQCSYRGKRKTLLKSHMARKHDNGNATDPIGF